MNHWLFISAAYAVALAGLGSALLHSWTAMRAAEAKADGLGDAR